jgi:hypothetical protein
MCLGRGKFNTNHRPLQFSSLVFAASCQSLRLAKLLLVQVQFFIVLVDELSNPRTLIPQVFSSSLDCDPATRPGNPKPTTRGSSLGNFSNTSKTLDAHPCQAL